MLTVSKNVILRQCHVDVLALPWLVMRSLLVLQKSGKRSKKVAKNIYGIIVKVGVPTLKKCPVEIIYREVQNDVTLSQSIRCLVSM